MKNDNTNISAKIALLLIFTLGGFACVGNTANKKTTENAGDSNTIALTQNATKHLQFIGMSVFDKQLSAAMNDNYYEIQVSIITPFSTNDIPKKLDTWLTVIDNLGGEIKVESLEKVESVSDENARGFIVPIASALVTAFEEYREQQKYGAAQNYNATLFYKHNEDGEAIVEKVVFSHKQKPVNIGRE